MKINGPAPRPRILYLDLDALNPNHLGCYGYHRNTSPTIDAIAAEGLRCDNVYCSDAPCLPSRTALYQGRFGIHTGVVGHGGTAADPKREGRDRGFRSTYEEDSFPRQLQKLGYHTAMISPFGQRHAAHHFTAGFNEIHNTGEGGMESAEVVEPVIERWLQQNAAKTPPNKPWYLHINFWDIHTQYRVPADYGNPFADEPIAEWFTDEVIAEHIQRAGPHSAQDIGGWEDSDHARFPRTPARITDRATLKQWLDGYDVAIRYVDDAIARIVAMLKAAGVYEDTAIVISADHGTCHLPFIVKWPGSANQSLSSGKTDAALHYHLDWPPTCLELLGQDAADLTPDVWDGLSFADTIRGTATTGRDELILSQCAHVCQRSVRFNDGPHQWLYIRTYHDGLQPFRSHMLFDLATDPHELNDIADDHPNVLREATWRLMNWHDQAMATVIRDCSDPVDPMYTVLHEGGPLHARADGSTQQPPSFKRYLQRLVDTGRSEAAEDLRRRYPEHA